MRMNMDTLSIEATKYTPDIDLNTNGTISFIGKSYPENTFEFYAPVISWMEEFLSESSTDKITINFDISYFNSSSSKLFFDLFDLLEANNDKSSISISWIYDEENESAEEAGEDFMEDFENLNIQLVKR
jgi:hypothetical protein